MMTAQKKILEISENILLRNDSTPVLWGQSSATWENPDQDNRGQHSDADGDSVTKTHPIS